MALVVFGIGSIVIGFLSMFFVHNEVKVSEPCRSETYDVILEQNYIQSLEIKFLATRHSLCNLRVYDGRNCKSPFCTIRKPDLWVFPK